MVVINRDWAYWFAIGYYDGRAFGDVQDTPDLPIDDALKAAYKEGYDAGVTDYCTYDEEV